MKYSKKNNFFSKKKENEIFNNITSLHLYNIMSRDRNTINNEAYVVFFFESDKNIIISL